nr:DNA polymerase IV [Phytoactinopolyspora halophila]
MSGASILHADLDAFYASVEQRDEPSLRNRPVIVGHGVVLAASYEAKACGVRTAMSGAQARWLCPQAMVVEPRMAAYAAASRAVFALFEQVTPLVEGISIDEAFLDVGGLRRISGAPLDIARQLRRRVRDELGLPITVGIAATKFLAKVASAVAKPDGLLVVSPGQELDFLHPLPVERLWGVGPATARKLRAKGMATVGDVAAMPRRTLVSALGRAAGDHLHRLAQGQDARPVQTGRRRRSVGAQCALGQRPRPYDDVDAILATLLDRVGRRLRAGRRVGHTVMVRMRFADFSRATRSSTMSQATDETEYLLATARWLLARSWPMVEEKGLTLIGVAVTNLDDARNVQLALPLECGPARPLDAALDELRGRYGGAAVTRASGLGRSMYESPPQLYE